MSLTTPPATIGRSINTGNNEIGIDSSERIKNSSNTKNIKKSTKPKMPDFMKAKIEKSSETDFYISNTRLAFI